MQRRYITVDVFTDRAFGGNPLAVVLDAGELSTAQMQAIAVEFNYSETTFVLPARDPANDAQVRIFTVNGELPFAGHPNVGTAFVLAARASRPPARFKFEEGAGLVSVEIPGRGQRHRRRTDRAAAIEQADPIQRRAGGGLSFVVSL
jgi:trans-2,3-dihydro-3-hydroxyanthranilate isomerase